ncbi:hypothetical protein DM860_009788 [Cuscuta australis]|uniref:Uncharacterized protein n=1 Tax=Cuscuta australis TaxID=267555 RepID=A0A328DC55_9ASTE|nr:hypothetical protein DM860_009788 [Cuscuta australis]
MERRGVRLLVAAVVALLVILSRPQPTSANLMKVACIGICMRECRMAGIGVTACLKFCPVHCTPPVPPRRVFHCSLECLNQCISSGSVGGGDNISNNNNDKDNNNSDEGKQESCVSSCKSEKCDTSP